MSQSAMSERSERVAASGTEKLYGYDSATRLFNNITLRQCYLHALKMEKMNQQLAKALQMALESSAQDWNEDAWIAKAQSALAANKED